MTAVLTDPPATRVHVGQGEHYVTADPTVMLTTILGSCVAMCLRDPVAGGGGMNHCLVPEGAGSGAEAGRRLLAADATLDGLEVRAAPCSVP